MSQVNDTPEPIRPVDPNEAAQVSGGGLAPARRTWLLDSEINSDAKAKYAWRPGIENDSNTDFVPDSLL